MAMIVTRVLFDMGSPPRHLLPSPDQEHAHCALHGGLRDPPTDTEFNARQDMLTLYPVPAGLFLWNVSSLSIVLLETNKG